MSPVVVQETLSSRCGISSSCPCCSFVTNDLFLPPPSEKADTTTTPSIQDAVKGPISPVESWEILTEQCQTELELSGDGETSRIPVVVDTHGHGHLARDSQDVYNVAESGRVEIVVVSLTCAVEPADWQACLEYAAASSHRMAAIGVHPWYLADLSETWLSDLETILMEHSGCMVGEIGLCKMARFVRSYPAGKPAALQLQRDVFVQQLILAAKYQRPVSVHCVNQQGVLLEVLEQLAAKDSLPPAIALHSFSGTAHQVRQLLQWEASLQLSFPLLYFGFSHCINYAMSTAEKAQRQGRLTIQQVPPDRLLAESDVSCHANVAAGTAGAVAYLAWALNQPVATVADRTRQNGLRFLQTLKY